MMTEINLVLFDLNIHNFRRLLIENWCLFVVLEYF